jgi:hypothetical protein
MAPATVTNSTGASNVTGTAARLNGEVTATGGENPTVHICWGPTDNGTAPANWANDINLGAKGLGTFYQDITGLNPSTTYYYRCYVTNSGGAAWADASSSFTTSAPTDRIPPTTQIQVTPSANENGWHNSDITVNLTSADNVGGSGVKAIHYKLSGATQDDQTVSANTVSLAITNEGITTLTCYSIDNAGNQEAEQSLKLKLDKTPPVITASASPQPISNGWNNTDVTVTFSASDNLSGIKSVTNPVTVSTEGASQNITGEATDLAGNKATASATVSIDKTPPTITASTSPRPNLYGWNNTDVTVTFSASDSLSGVKSVTSPVSVTTEGAEQKVSGEAIDLAGNTATASVGVNIDKTPPVVSIAANPSVIWPPNHKMVDVTISGSATDSMSGIASTAFAVTDKYGTIAPTLSGFNTIIKLEAWREGSDKDGRTYTISVTAKDKADNTATSSATVICPHDQGKK